MLQLAIDPGSSSGAIVWEDSFGEIQSADMPQTPQDIYDFFQSFKVLGFTYTATLERVWGMPGMAGTAMFTFGKNVGHLELAMAAAKIPYQEVIPRTWQKFYSIGTSKDCANKNQWKNKLKAKAQNLFPNNQITLQNADAYLIYYWAKQQITCQTHQ